MKTPAPGRRDRSTCVCTAGESVRRREEAHFDATLTPFPQVLTDSNVDNARAGLDLIEQVEGRVACITGDAAYDTAAIYDAALGRGAKVVVPPVANAVVSGRGQRATARDRTIRKVKRIGRRQWKKESGYHRQGTVENAFYRYKSIIGDRLRARHPKSQSAEALFACNVLNRMFELGRPTSEAIRPVG